MTRRRNFAAALVAAALALPALVLPGTASALALVRDAEIERTLNRMAAPIFQAAGIDPSTVEIFLVNDRSLNAFVAGGRRIFLNTGLMIELETPEELLGVIAHETGHIAGGHEARRAITLRNAQGPALIGLLAGIAAGAAGGGEAAAAIAGGTQGILGRTLLSHSRSEEASADQAAEAIEGAPCEGFGAHHGELARRAVLEGVGHQHRDARPRKDERPPNGGEGGTRERRIRRHVAKRAGVGQEPHAGSHPRLVR